MIKVEEGKFYRTFGGQKVGPMRRWKGSDKFECDKDDNRLWNEDGSRGTPGQGESFAAEWGAADAFGWIAWTGGDCPVKGAVAVEYQVGGQPGTEHDDLAHNLRWAWRHGGKWDDIVAYRIAKQEPRSEQALDAASLIPLPRVPRFGGEEISIEVVDKITPALAAVGERLVIADLLAALEECRDAETKRRADLKPGAPATQYTEARLARINTAIAHATGRGIRAQSFAERERDLLEANNRYLEEARTARRMLEVMTEQNRRRGITILGMSKFGGAHLSRAETAEREVKELRHAIMAGEPAPEFADTIGHGNYLEMARSLHDAVAGGQETIRRLTEDCAIWQDKALTAETDLDRVANRSDDERGMVWLVQQLGAHQRALAGVLPYAESRAEDMQESDAENLPEFEESPETVKAVAAVDTAKRLLGII